MKRNLVISSNLYSVGFENNTLEIEFKNGGIYQYYGVPDIVYKSLLMASSHGQFFHYNIRERFPFVKVG